MPADTEFYVRLPAPIENAIRMQAQMERRTQKEVVTAAIKQ